MTDEGRPVGLIETMRDERGEVALLDLHLARVLAAAEEWGYPADRTDLVRRITEAAEAGDARLRLVLWPDGSVALERGSLPSEPFRTAAIYPEPIEEAGTWRCALKTTARAHYDRALAWAAVHGVDEPILLNPRGEIMEGARTSVFVREGGSLMTPPLASGGLDGVMRCHLLRLGATERPLTPRDLTEAEEVLLVNALRGRMSVELREVP